MLRQHHASSNGWHARSAPTAPHLLACASPLLLQSRAPRCSQHVASLVPSRHAPGSGIPDHRLRDSSCRRRAPATVAQASSSAAGGWEDPGGITTPQPAAAPPPPQTHPLSLRVQQWLAARLQPAIAWATLYQDILLRILLTVALLVVVRCGLFIPLPGLDFSLFPEPATTSEGERLVRALYGQARALPASLFELGISPFINASILVTMVLAMPEQLVAWSPLTRLREARKEGRAGQAYITSVLNWLALAFSVYLALVKAFELQPYAVAPGPGFIPLTAMTLVAGSAIIQHCASVITASGIGNGSSLIICCGIVTEYAEALHSVMSRFEAGAITPPLLAVLGGAYLLLALAAVYISRTELRLPVLQYSRSSNDPQVNNGPGPGGAPQPQDQDQDLQFFVRARRVAEQRMARKVQRAEYFPIAINGSGMMSIILAGAFWFFMVPAGAELLGLTALHAALLSLQSSWGGLLVYAFLVFAVEFLPLGSVNPKEVAEYFNAVNVGIKGVVPGEPTEQHVQAQQLRCKFWGGLALGCLAVAAHVFDAACLSTLGASLSATSLLIIVGTVIQSSRQVESLLEAPRLNHQLAKEQELVLSLSRV